MFKATLFKTKPIFICSSALDAMEKLAWVQATNNSRIPSPCYSNRLIDSHRKPISINETHLKFGIDVQPIKVQGLALQSSSYDEGGSIAQPGAESLQLSMNLEPISSESQFDRVVAEAQQLEESVVVLWMASWCRKCIYLKPKLEKLAAEYYPSIRFYAIDVNNVPHKLVVRAGVARMPTIQLWRDGKKQSEVIGGHKAYLVVNEIREMIENENSL